MLALPPCLSRFNSFHFYSVHLHSIQTDLLAWMLHHVVLPKCLTPFGFFHNKMCLLLQKHIHLDPDVSLSLSLSHLISSGGLWWLLKRSWPLSLYFFSTSRLIKCSLFYADFQVIYFSTYTIFISTLTLPVFLQPRLCWRWWLYSCDITILQKSLNDQFLNTGCAFDNKLSILSVSQYSYST